jgi:dolichyl-phosphate-mannose-protein mannosyltransferase
MASFTARRAFALLLIGGLALRAWIAYVLFPDQGFAGDLSYHEGWMRVLDQVGPGGFYANVRDALPPGFLWLLWPLSKLAGILPGLTGMRYDEAIAALVKVPAIVADLLVAALLYRVVGRWSGRRAGLTAAALFLFIPVTWYESALWGQIDSIGALLILAAIVLLVEGWSEAASAAAVMAVLVKPQFGIVLFIVAIVLLRRHLLAAANARPAGSEGRIRHWLLSDQGPRRLGTSALVGLVVGLVLILPFDLETRAPASVAGVPLVRDAAGLLVLTTGELSHLSPLTANAYNGWALVGPDPLAVGGIAHWTDDSLRVVDGFSAFTVGALLLSGLGILVAAALLRRDDRISIVLAATIVAAAVFILPTRVHERYLFPAFALAAPLAATSRSWRAWYFVMGIATVANLHAVLTHGGTSGVVSLPFAALTRSEPVVRVIAITETVLFGWALLAWAVWHLRPRLLRKYTGSRWRAEKERAPDGVDPVA